MSSDHILFQVRPVLIQNKISVTKQKSLPLRIDQRRDVRLLSQARTREPNVLTPSYSEVQRFSLCHSQMIVGSILSSSDMP